MAVPYVFIGCAGEALGDAQRLREAVETHLGTTALVEVWNDEGAFGAGSVLIQKLQDKAETVDFAVLLVTATGEEGMIAPNVLFELGLFLGQLERYRTLIVKSGVDLPSDLDGVIYLDWESGVESVAREIAGRVTSFGRRVKKDVELGSLERMLNVCTPGYRDHETPHLSWIKPEPKESFTSAEDYYELCQCLLNRYVIGSMEPNATRELRAYLAIYIGDGITIRHGGETHTVRRCSAPGGTQARADATFLISMSNPRRQIDIDAGLDFGELLPVNWAIGMPIAGYKDGDPRKPRSACARVFAEGEERLIQSSDQANLVVDNEQEVFSVPILWKEQGHTASVGVLGLSASQSGLATDHRPMMRRLQLVGNVLGVAANRLSHELAPAAETGIGIEIDDQSERRSFARRAVALRRAVGERSIEDLLESGKVEIRIVEEEPVLARLGHV